MPEAKIQMQGVTRVFANASAPQSTFSRWRSLARSRKPEASHPLIDHRAPMRANRSMRVGVLVIVCALVLASCSSSTAGGGEVDGPRIRIAGFDFEENILLAEIYRQALRAKGFDAVVSDSGLARREIVEGLRGAEIDLVIDYLGAAIVAFSNGEVSDPSPRTGAAERQLNEVLEPQDLVALDVSPAQDTEALVVTRETARANNIETMSELKQFAPMWTLGGPPACPDEQRCLSGLANIYGLEFESFRELDSTRSLAEALVGDEVQVGVMQSSAGEIPAFELARLADDERRVPVQNVTPIVRAELREQVGMQAFDAAVDAVSAALTTDELAELNARVSIAGEDPEEVATTFLAGKRLLR